MTRGDVRTVTYSARASCLDERCVATRGSKRIALRPVVVTVGQEKSTAAWPPLEVRGRVCRGRPGAARARRLRSDTSPPAVTYRVAPGTPRALLEVFAVVLAVGGLSLGAWRRSPPSVAPAPRRAADATSSARSRWRARRETRPPPDRAARSGCSRALLDARAMPRSPAPRASSRGRRRRRRRDELAGSSRGRARGGRDMTSIPLADAPHAAPGRDAHARSSASRSRPARGGS